MPSVGVITLDIRLNHAHSLKDKRQVVRSLKDRLRSRHNVAVAEIDYQDLWQRALLAAVTVSGSRAVAEGTLRAVEKEAADALGACLADAAIEWID